MGLMCVEAGGGRLKSAPAGEGAGSPDAAYNVRNPRGPAMRYELCGIERPGKPRTLGVKLFEAPEDVGVYFEWQYESHQPNSDGSWTAAGGLGLHRDMPLKDHYYVDEGQLEEHVLSRVASVSSERFWISVKEGEDDILRIPGNEIAGVLAGLGRTFRPLT